MMKQSMTMDKSDTDALRFAVQVLEHPSLAAHIADVIGRPVELLGKLPAGASQAITKATTKSLEAALKVALLTIRGGSQESSQILHRALVVASGATGGALGAVSLPIELPVSTIIILRSILDIARSEGENLADPDASLSCLQVFALGGRTSTDDGAESGYFAVRAGLATAVTTAAHFIAEGGIVKESSPALVRLIALIASRFGLVVSQKVAAQAIPVLGALGGAAINYLFMDHFQSVALGHFTVRRLERKYGKDIVAEAYKRLKQDLDAPERPKA